MYCVTCLTYVASVTVHEFGYWSYFRSGLIIMLSLSSRLWSKGKSYVIESRPNWCICIKGVDFFICTRTSRWLSRIASSWCWKFSPGNWEGYSTRLYTMAHNREPCKTVTWHDCVQPSPWWNSQLCDSKEKDFLVKMLGRIVLDETWKEDNSFNWIENQSSRHTESCRSFPREGNVMNIIEEKIASLRDAHKVTRHRHFFLYH